MRNPLSLAVLVAAWSLVTSCIAFNVDSLPSLERRATSDNLTNQSSTFLYVANGNTQTNLTFTIRYVDRLEDILFRLQAPDLYSWVAVGFGKQMQGSLMFVFYADADGKDLVYSPRTSWGHVEPSYNPKLKLEKVDLPSNDSNPTGIYGGTWNIAAKCPNCWESLGVGSGVDPINWSGTQDMIFAFGPPLDNPNSDALDAPLRRHTAYGDFNIDLSKATVSSKYDSVLESATVPPLGTGPSNSHIVGSMTNDHEPSSVAHAVLMSFAFLIVFPLGVLCARVLEKVKWHAGIQAIGLLVVLIAMAIGIYMSKYYNRSKHLSNGHQIFGFIIVAFLIIQWAAGFVHHRHFAKHGNALKGGLIIKIHRIVGPLVMAAGIINGAFGFRFALTRWNIIYAPIVIAVVIVMLGAVAVKGFFQRRRAGPKSSGVEGLGPSAGYAQPSMQPPAYPAQPAPPYNASQPYGEPQPYTGYGGSQPYGNPGWDKSDIALQSLEPQHPKQMI